MNARESNLRKRPARLAADERDDDTLQNYTGAPHRIHAASIPQLNAATATPKIVLDLLGILMKVAFFAWVMVGMFFVFVIVREYRKTGTKSTSFYAKNPFFSLYYPLF